MASSILQEAWGRLGARLLLGASSMALCAGCAVAQMNECFKAPRAIVAPQEGLIYRSTLVAPSLNAPGIVDFRSVEQFLLNINRTSASMTDKRSMKSAPLSIKILLKDPVSGRYDVHCEVSRVHLDEPFRDLRYFVYSPKARDKEWRIQVVDHGNSEMQVYGIQDSLDVQVLRFPTDRNAPDANGAQNQGGALSLNCEGFWARINQFFANGPVRQEVSIGPAKRSQTFFVRTTGPVQVEFHTDVAKLPPLSVRPPPASPDFYVLPQVTVAVKEDGAGPFSVGCNQSPGLGGTPLEAAQFTLTRSYQPNALPVWRVDINPEKRLNFETKVVLRYPVADSSKEPFPTEFQCAPPNTSRVGGVAASTKAFAGATVLQVALIDPESLLTSEALAEITKHMLLGMALWRPVCYLCTEDQLAIAKVDGRTYILEALQVALDRFYQSPWVAPPPNPLQIQVPPLPRGKYQDLMSSLGARHQPRGTSSNSGYVEMRSPTVGVQGLCNDDFSDLPVSLQRVRLALQCAGDQDISKANLLRASARLSFLTGPLDGCPNGANTVACESSALKIEFNAKDYTFLSHHSRQPIVGTGKRQVDLLHVLTHEIGHWIGIGHLSQRGSMMNETMTGSRCIDGAASNALNVLAAGGAFPVAKPQALLWEEGNDKP